MKTTNQITLLMQLSWECKKLSHNILRTDWTRKKRKWNLADYEEKQNKIFIKGLISINFAEIKECMFLFCRVTEALFSLVQRGTNTAVVAMSTINNLALEKGYDVCIMWNMLWRAVYLSFLSLNMYCQEDI